MPICRPVGLEILVAFALASWFVDCFPVAPVLFLLGPENNEITGCPAPRVSLPSPYPVGRRRCWRTQYFAQRPESDLTRRSA